MLPGGYKLARGLESVIFDIERRFFIMGKSRFYNIGLERVFDQLTDMMFWLQRRKF